MPSNCGLGCVGSAEAEVTAFLQILVFLGAIIAMVLWALRRDKKEHESKKSEDGRKLK